MSAIGSAHLREELIHALAQSPLLRMLGRDSAIADELRKMLDESSLQMYDAGEVIIQEGSSSDGLFILVEGQVDVYKGSKHVGTLSQVGDVFGEVGMIAGCLRTATVKASGAVVCLKTGAVLKRRLSDQENLLFSMAMQQALSQILLRRLQQLNAEIVALQSQVAERDRELDHLQQQNRFLEQRVDGLVKERSKGFRGTRSRWGKKEE